MLSDWKKFNGGVMPNGYEVHNFIHCGLMIRKLPTEKLLTSFELTMINKKMKKFYGL